jgi:hypothetical protein
MPERPRRKSDYRLEAIDGELLIYHPTETNVVYCNQTASLIWHLCDGTHTAAEISTLLSEAYPAAAVSIPADVDATLRTLTQQQVIEWV